ncbi:MAG: hypothetical protein U1A72_25060 [Sulfuritalea sp.]|nr:hypothetical protein [Sulfuritalea sp.]
MSKNPEARLAQHARSPAAGNAVDVYAARDAEAAALTAAGADDCQRRESDARRRADSELLDALQRKLAAEELAILQAQNRSQAEMAAETVAADRAHAERQLEIASRSRIDAEQRALADTKRREFAASELAKATQARLTREREAEAIARERAEAERNAADLAEQTIRSERELEALTLARTTAERDAAQQAARRKLQDDEAADALRVRLRAQQDEREIKDAHDSAKALAAAAHRQRLSVESELAAHPPTPAPIAADQRSPAPSRQLLRLGLMLCIGVALGYALGNPGIFQSKAWFQGELPEAGKLKLDRNLSPRTGASKPGFPAAH